MAAPKATVVKLFADICRRFPGNVAVEDGVDNLTYEELDVKSTELADQLCRLGVKNGQIIPLVTQSCLYMVIGVLAILKIGAVYVPLDRSQWPMAKIEKTIRRLGSTTVLFTGECLDIGDATTIGIESMLSASGNGCVVAENGTNGTAAEGDENLACIIFTSGTTGEAKGVMIRDSSIAHLVSSSSFNYNVTPEDRVLLVLSVAFDACMGTLFSTLCNGGTVVLANGNNFQERVKRCSVFVGTPSVLQSLCPPETPYDYPVLDRIILGGETASPKLLEAWKALRRPIWIVYGPTEATCATLTGLISISHESGEFQPKILGDPIAGAEITLVDKKMKTITDVDHEGEILISGPGLARGYWKDERRSQDSFFTYNGRRVYRTGDYARWTLDGLGRRSIYFCGRKDRIVKLRGFLVNLDVDIDDAILSTDPSLEAAYSFVADEHLCTVVKPRAIDIVALRANLQLFLPPYMIPHRICAFDRFPTTANGKLDSGKLRQMMEVSTATENDQEDDNTHGGANPTSTLLRSISQVLGIPQSKIDCSRSFVSHGVYSLLAARLSAQWRKHGYTISPQCILMAARIEDVIRSLPHTPRSTKPPDPCWLVVDDDSVIAPLTNMQLHFVYGSLKEPHINVINHVLRCESKSLRRLQEAWAAVAQIEPIFRTKIEACDGKYVQRLTQTYQTSWTEKFIEYERLEEELQVIAAATGLGSQFTVLRVRGSSEVILNWSIHHALMDGFSAMLILNKVELVLAGQEIKSSVPFPVAAKQLRAMEYIQAVASRKFWKEQESLHPQAMGDLNIQEPEQFQGCLTHAEYSINSPELAEMSVAHSAATSITPAAIYYAAWSLLMSIYTGSSTVIFGAVVAGRNLDFDWTDSLVGPLLDTLPFRATIDRRATTENFLHSIHQSIQLISKFHCTSEQKHSSDFSTALAVQYDIPRWNKAKLCCSENSKVVEYPDLPIMVIVEGEGCIRFLYKIAKISKSDVEMLATIYENLMRALMEPGLTIEECLERRFSKEMTESILASGNAGSIKTYASDSSETVETMFDKAAKRHSSQIALEKGHVQVTYSELAQHVDRLASAICIFVQPGETVCLMADRSVHWIIGIFAIIKASAIYCPLDVGHSPEYRAKLSVLANAKLLICNETTQMGSFVGHEAPIICSAQVLYSHITPKCEERSISDPKAPAFLVFTSGTTGPPKGVLIEHRGLVALLESHFEVRLRSEPGRRIAQFLSPGFDVCLHEILAALCYGSTLVLRKDPKDPFSHLGDVDTAMLTPSVAASLEESEYKNLHYVYLVGEPVPQRVVELWDRERTVYNGYGPAEGTVLTSIALLRSGRRVNVGRPLPTMRIYILNDHLQLLPPGVIGKLFIAGVQISRGYINNNEQTKQNFLPDPYAAFNKEGERMYCTGDLGFIDRQGDVHVCGRKDRQIKLRGFRINLDEVANVASQQMPVIRTAFATQRSGNLVLWVEPADVDVELLKALLEAALPRHAIPSYIVPMDQLPLSPNGKVNTHKIKLIALPGGQQTPKEMTRLSSTEMLIADEWRSLIGIDNTTPIYKFDNFVALGGHSILQLNLTVRLREKFGAPLTIKDIINASSLSALASIIDTKLKKTGGSETVGGDGEPLSQDLLSPPEIEWWYRYAHSEQQSAFNIPFVARIPPGINLQKLEKLIHIVLARHIVLRSQFVSSHDGSPRRIVSNKPLRLSKVDELDIHEFINRPFDLSKDQLIRVALTSSVVAFTISHILADLTALRRLLVEIAALYNGEAQIMPPCRQYFDVMQWSKPVPYCDISFWHSYLQGLPLLTSSGRRMRSYRGTSLVWQVPHDLFELILVKSLNEHVSLHQFALSAVGILMGFLSGRRDMILGSPYINRASGVDQNVVGLFLEALPIRVRWPHERLTTIELLHETRLSSQSALAHAVPWANLMKQLGLPFPSKQQQLFNCVVTFHDDRDIASIFPIEGVESLSVWAEGSKFAACFEFQACSDRLTVRLEYDTDILTSKHAEILHVLLLHTMQKLLDHQATYVEMVHQLNDLLEYRCAEYGVQSSEMRTIITELL